MSQPAIDSELWSRIDGIVDAALDSPPEERDAVIKDRCGADEELLAHVDAFLKACAAAETMVFTPPEELAAEALEAMAAEADRDGFLGPGTPVGNYEIVSMIGRGGMGNVYLARRADGQFEKEVAIKVIKRGMDTDEIVRRFYYERQILARLEHPNIAHLLDGGVTDSGLPYFVMEYVEGEPIDEYCTSRNLDTRERLELFQIVCSGVEYAHKNLVVHRDLKPDNVLITAEGEVKLLDFGIAKLTDPDELADDAPVTRAQTRRLTPEYAAPEQIVGEPVTTATDVYALGMILYELLTGKRPYEFKNRTYAEYETVICDVVPDRPSVAVSEDGLDDRKTRQRRLKGDLDAIVLTALRKEQDDRYASAGALAADIERHFRGRTVSAHTDTGLYRARKFVLRNKLVVVATALIIGALLAGLASTLWQNREARRQAELASQEARRAVTTRDFALDMLRLGNPDAMREPSVALDDTFTVRQMLAAGISRLDVLTAPSDRALVMEMIGKVAIEFSGFATAGSLYSEAIQIRRSFLEDDHSGLAESLLGRGIALHNLGRFAEADTIYQEAREILHNVDDPDELVLADIENTLGYIKFIRQQLSDSEFWYRSARERASRLFDEMGPTENLERILAESTWGLGVNAKGNGDYPNAEKYLREAARERARVLGDDHPQVMHALYDLANCLVRMDRTEEAEELLLKTRDAYRDVLGLSSLPLANNLTSLGSLYRNSGRLDLAEANYRAALSMYRQVVPASHAWSATPMYGLALVLMQTSRSDSALVLLRTSLDISDSARLGLSQIRTRLALARSLMQLGRRDEGISVATEAEDLLARISPPDTLAFFTEFASVFALLGERVRSADYERRASSDSTDATSRRIRQTDQ